MVQVPKVGRIRYRLWVGLFLEGVEFFRSPPKLRFQHVKDRRDRSVFPFPASGAPVLRSSTRLAEFFNRPLQRFRPRIDPERLRRSGISPGVFEESLREATLCCGYCRLIIDLEVLAWRSFGFGWIGAVSWV
ncbi:uncharacterized protein [Physcomitrium patens]|uniref:uncharacterized protein n=1 Tax=Physcomitrium patens TaxID=3218 RepID=UPI003CCD9934